jgi:hypothetical protein
MLLSADGDGRVNGAEAAALDELRAAVGETARQLSDDSPWAGALAILDEELGDGHPFFFRIALASSSRSKSDVSVVPS